MFLFRAKKLLRGFAPQGELPKDSELLKTTLHMAWPSIVESFLVALVGMVDTMMVSTIGEHAIAAVGLTTQPKFIGLAIFLSLNVAVSALVARRKGEQDQESANRVMMQSIVITVILTVIVSTITVAFADPIIRLAGSASDTHEEAVAYYRIIMGGMLFQTLSIVINAAQRGAGNTRISMRTNIASNLVNIVLNYLLIGGNFGFPRLGVAGAAIATVAGTVVACIMSFVSVSHPKKYLFLGHARGGFRFDRRTLSAIANIGSSTLAEQIFMRIGFLIYSIIVAHLGTMAFAAHQIGMNMMSLSFSFGDGLSVAAVSLIGQSLGAKRQDLARIYGSICQRIGILFSLILSLVFIFLGRSIFSMFSDEAQILDYGVMIMNMMTIVVFLQIAQVIFSGCLRGAGDTRYIAFISLISVALIRPGCGYLFCYPLNLGLFGAWLGLAIDQSMRFLLTYLRFKSGKWMYMRI